MKTILIAVLFLGAFPVFAYTLEAKESPVFVLNKKSDILAGWERMKNEKSSPLIIPEKAPEPKWYTLEGTPEPFVYRAPKFF